MPDVSLSVSDRLNTLALALDGLAVEIDYDPGTGKWRVEIDQGPGYGSRDAPRRIVERATRCDTALDSALTRAGV